MVTRHCNRKLGFRFAEELQLIAEEKWILDALHKIKKQRNSLQIERLQLESLKVDLNCSVDAKLKKSNTVDEIPTTSTIDLMQSSKIDPNPLVTLDSALPTNPPECLNFDVQCNNEELNLNVTTPVFNTAQNIDNNIEEDESEDDEDNVFIDINMLMNGIQDENLD